MTKRENQRLHWNISGEQRERIKKLPPSSKYVYTALKANDHLSQGEIVTATLLPKRTVRSALDTLERADLIKIVHCIDDARRRRYRAKTSESSDYPEESD